MGRRTDSQLAPLVVGLTGGTGVGKTTVASLLGEHGGIIVDCDQLGRDVVLPGGGALEGIFRQFGDGVRADDDTLDRAALAEIVFNDAGALEALNAITHPAIDELIAGEIASATGDDVVILDMAVLVESSLGAGQYHRVAVVEADLDTRIERLAGRGMTAEDARARIASQASDEERRAVADHIVDNSGDLDALGRAVEALWRRIEVWRGEPRPTDR